MSDKYDSVRILLKGMVDGDRISGLLLSSALERQHEWDKWTQEIPFIRWPVGWYVKAIPPFGGAIVRYYVSDKLASPICAEKNHTVSIYLDCYDELGFFGSPYWEVYPINGDTARFAMADTTELIQVITEEFERRKNEA